MYVVLVYLWRSSYYLRSNLCRSAELLRSRLHCHHLYEEIIDNCESSSTPIMEALKLQKKYPEVSRDEMFDFINRFKSVSSSLAQNIICDLSLVH